MKYHAPRRPKPMLGRDVIISPAMLEAANKILKEMWTPMPNHTPEERAKWREIHGRDPEPTTLRPVPESGELKPLFVVESRPSSVNGFQFWAVLSYKEHNFSLPLPQDFMGMDEVGQNLALAPVAERLRAQLAPILIAEDADDWKLEPLEDVGE